jgi:DNA modification methylase
VFLWGADYYFETLARKYPNLGSWIIWDKYSDDRVGLLDGKFGSSFETCWSKQVHKRELARVLVTTNYTARGDETRVHPTQKPVELLEWLVKTYTNENEVVLDNCMGVGSTGVACKNTKRKFIGIELDKTYFDIAVSRLS